MKQKLLFVVIFFFFLASNEAQNVFMQDGNITQCSGTFSDSGGTGSSSGFYGFSEDYTLTICPDQAENRIRLSFTQFGLDERDTMYLYDGDNLTSPLIGEYSGVSSLGVIDVTNSAGCITVRFKSNPFAVTVGWEAEITCIPAFVGNFPSDMVSCDDNNDNTEQFDLTTQNAQILSGLDASNYNVSYHVTELDAVNNQNEIINASNYTNLSNPQTVFVRIENTANGTFGFDSFNLIASAFSLNQYLTFEWCNPYGDDFLPIGELEYQNNIVNNENDNEYSFSYYETIEDANANVNAIPNPDNYYLTGNRQFLYVSATSNNTGCRAVAEVQVIIYYVNVDNTTPLEVCNTTDFASFNLELNKIQNDPFGNYLISYHLTYSDASNNVNPLPLEYQNISNPQTIYIRAEDQNGGFSNECYRVETLDLVVNTGTPVTANDIGDVTICDSELNYDLTYHETEITGGQTGIIVNYYNTLNALLQETNAILNPNSITLNESGTNTYYVRVDADASNCFNTTEINVTVQSDSTLDAANISYCGSSQVFDLQLAINQINNAFDGNISFHETETDALSNSNAISNINNYTASSNNQTIYSRGLITAECYGVGTVELISETLPTANAIPTQLLCGFSQEHDITTVESAIIGTQTDVTTSYFTSLADLQTNINAITNATNYNFTNAGTYTFYVRVDSNITGCYGNIEVEFSVGDNFDTYDTYLSKCDDDFDGVSTFNLEESIQYITSDTGVTITFFQSIEDAQANTNVVANVASYTNATPYLDLVYARAEHASGCVNFQQLYLVVSGIEPVASVSSLNTCDDNYNDGFAEFTLSDIQNEALGNNTPGEFLVNYFETLADAENYTNSLPVTYTNTVASQQTIYARTTWQYDVDCYYIVPVELNVMPPPVTIQGELQLFGCDENSDGIIVFDLDSIVDDILNGTPDTEIKFYANLGESLDPNKALTSPYYTPGRIVARGTTSAGCSTAVYLNLIVEDCPQFVTCGTPVNTTYCYTENDTTEFRFKSTDGSPLVVVFNEGEIEYGFDILKVFDSDGVTNLNTITPWGNEGDVSRLTFTSSGDRMTISILSDDIYSCSDEGYTPLDFDVLCQSDAGIIQVNMFIDKNNDGIFNGIDMPFTNGFSTYEANNDGNITTVNSNTGSYTITNIDEANSYDITFATNAGYENCFNIPTTLVENVMVLNGNTVTINFPITEQMPCEDLAVYLVPWESPRPGFDTWIEIMIEDLGSSTITSGTVTFQHDPLVSLASTNTTDTGLTITPTGTGATIDFTNLLPGETRKVLVLLNTPISVNLGEFVTHSATYTSATNDVIATNNESTITLEVIGSYDPNDIIESHGNDIIYDDFITTDEYLYYTIRFQNVGTAEAITVRVENTIDALLDMSTLQMLSSSHNYVLEQNGNQLTWTFNNIDLPAQQDDDFGSNGYVYLKIKPTAGYNVGTIIPDTAEIYFDFNAPVITNTFLTEYVNTLSVSRFDSNAFSLYPNPVKETVNIKLNNALRGKASVEIIDVQGKIIVQDSITETLQVNVSELETGLYFVKLKHDDGESVKKLIIK